MNIYQLLSCDFHDTKFNTKMWSKLPKDILQIILCYHGAIADRNGRFIDRIYKYDPRYMVLSTIPRIEIITPNGMNNSLIMKVCFSNKKMEMYKYIHNIAHNGNFSDFYNFETETETMICRGYCVNGYTYMFTKHINPFYWFRKWLHCFPYQLRH